MSSSDSRKQKRNIERQLNSIKEKAKAGMFDWITSLDHSPSPQEIEAWKSGYIAGMNRNNNDNRS
jgi:hypothetical protein